MNMNREGSPVKQWMILFTTDSRNNKMILFTTDSCDIVEPQPEVQPLWETIAQAGNNLIHKGKSFEVQKTRLPSGLN